MQDHIRKDLDFIAQTYNRNPLLFVEGRGMVVKDESGRSYIDCVSGIAVNNTGHCHPRVVEAICRQAKKLIHTSNLYHTEPQLKLAEKLHKLSGGYMSFFCNSGAEANEAAIKLARKFTGKGEIITALNSFHGRTLATLQATGQDKYKKGFDPLPAGFKHVPYGDAAAVEQAITKDTAAVFLEPIQGEGGVIIPNDNYLKEVAAVCRSKNTLLMLDEVQTGFGRTGAMFAWQDFDIEPDIFTVAKAMGGGMPIGAMMAKKHVMAAFEKGDHASTFGGNPVAAAAASVAVDVIIDERLLERSREMGSLLINGFNELKTRHAIIKEVRGKGLMIGLELNRPGKAFVDKAVERGLLLNCVQERILRFTPPLVIDRKTVDIILKVLDELFSEARHND